MRMLSIHIIILTLTIGIVGVANAGSYGKSRAVLYLTYQMEADVPYDKHPEISQPCVYRGPEIKGRHDKPTILNTDPTRSCCPKGFSEVGEVQFGASLGSVACLED